jgi:diphosphomevalonate decarboxylase
MGELSALIAAPSNIALIKYMGKLEGSAQANLPENSSLSMTLDSLATWVEIVRTPVDGRSPEAARLGTELPRGAPSTARLPQLGDEGVKKVLRHVERTRAAMPAVLGAHGLRMAEPGALILRTANTFPEASGIASSASSFAGITLAVALACAEDPAAFDRALSEPSLRRNLARISRQGSGSSCRSFEGPFVLWEGEGAQAVDASGLPPLSHFVVLIDSGVKSVSSSDAHARVKTSPLWEGRVARVTQRLKLLRAALAAGDLPALARLAWSESWEMHSLFHTASEPFSYWKPGSIDALHWLAPVVAGKSPAVRSAVPPIVTMDAGPNVHIIVQSQDTSEWRELLRGRFGSDAVLEDRPGLGARIERVSS